MERMGQGTRANTSGEAGAQKWEASRGRWWRRRAVKGQGEARRSWGGGDGDARSTPAP